MIEDEERTAELRPRDAVRSRGGSNKAKAMLLAIAPFSDGRWRSRNPSAGFPPATAEPRRLPRPRSTKVGAPKR